MRRKDWVGTGRVCGIFGASLLLLSILYLAARTIPGLVILTMFVLSVLLIAACYAFHAIAGAKITKHQPHVKANKIRQRQIRIIRSFKNVLEQDRMNRGLT